MPPKKEALGPRQQAFEAKEAELLDLLIEMVADCGVSDPAKAKPTPQCDGSGNNLKRRGVVKGRMQLECNACEKTVTLSACLKRHCFVAEHAVLERLSMEAREEREGMKKQSMHVCNSDEEVDLFSNNPLKESMDIGEARKRASPDDVGATPARPERGTKVQATPSRGAFGPLEGSGYSVLAKQVALLHEQLESQGALMGQMADSIALAQTQIQTLQSQLSEQVVIGLSQKEMINMLKKELQERDDQIFAHRMAQEASSEDTKHEEFSDAAKGEAAKQHRPSPPKTSTPPPAPTQAPEAPKMPLDGKRTYAATAAQPGTAPPKLSAAKERFLKARAKPHSEGPTKVVVAAFQWHAVDRKSFKKEFQTAREFLRAAGVEKEFVREISFRGSSVLEVFVEESLVESVKRKVNAFVGGNAYLSEAELNGFQHGKLDAAAALNKAISRAVFLCARHSYVPMQECILREIPKARHDEVKRQAEAIRVQWKAQAKKNTGDVGASAGESKMDLDGSA